MCSEIATLIVVHNSCEPQVILTLQAVFSRLQFSVMSSQDFVEDGFARLATDSSSRGFHAVIATNLLQLKMFKGSLPRFLPIYMLICINYNLINASLLN